MKNKYTWHVPDGYIAPLQYKYTIEYLLHSETQWSNQLLQYSFCLIHNKSILICTFLISNFVMYFPKIIWYWSYEYANFILLYLKNGTIKLYKKRLAIEWTYAKSIFDHLRSLLMRTILLTTIKQDVYPPFVLNAPYEHVHNIQSTKVSIHILSYNWNLKKWTRYVYIF